MQGTLLSRLVPPLYMKGIIVGDVFNAEHISRAICCRSEKALRESNSTLPLPFSLHHPIIVHTSNNIQPRHERIKKRSHVSINWAENDAATEEIDSKTGWTKSNSRSRICKRSMLTMFCNQVPLSEAMTCHENKLRATLYQQAKGEWRKSIGNWVCKPHEVDDFSIIL